MRLPAQIKNIPLKLKTLGTAIAFAALLCMLPLGATAQQGGAAGAFHAAANHYIAGEQQDALKTVEQALRKYPNDARLQALHKKLTEQQQQQQNPQENQDKKQDQNQQSKQQQKSSAGEQSEEDLNQQGQKKEQPSDQQKEGEKQEQQRESDDGKGEERQAQARDPKGEVEKRLQEMNISPEKARMMLEAMKSNEIQYLQQKQRQPARRQKSDKPDW